MGHEAALGEEGSDRGKALGLRHAVAEDHEAEVGEEGEGLSGLVEGEGLDEAGIRAVSGDLVEGDHAWGGGETGNERPEGL